MTTRLLAGAVMRRLWHLRISQQHKTSNHLVLWKHAPRVQASFLYTKILDKDADLNKQRQENNQEYEKETEEYNEERVIGSKATRLNTKESRRTKSFHKVNETTDLIDAKWQEDANVFGNAKLDEEEDPGESQEEELQRKSNRRTRKLDIYLYSKEIKEHLNNNRLKEAINVLEVRMLKEDGAKPDAYIYNLLISGCAKAGYTRKAFRLFTRMRQRGFKAKGGTYTSLFHACANAPSSVDGLSRANYLRETMRAAGYQPNVKNYNVMIKAYGRCGDVETAYSLADEMIENQIEFNTETYNFLLQASASDLENGFRFCILTWHQMLQKGMKPDYYTFSTLLRCIRDCGFGNLENMQDALEMILKDNISLEICSNQELNSYPLLETNDLKEKQPTDTNHEVQVQVQVQNSLEPSKPQNSADMILIKSESVGMDVPDLLSPKPHLGNLMALSEVNLPHERFLLVGGLTKFLQIMKNNHITPDIEMFTLMLEVIPPTIAAEKQVLSFIRKIGLKSDIDFFNILIKKRSMRLDYNSAKEVLSMIHTAKLKPDIVTYGVLALGCQTQEEARELLQRMEEKDIRINIQILGAMLRQGCEHKNFSYINEIMRISIDEKIKPNKLFLTHLYNFHKRCARAIDARHPLTKTKIYKQKHTRFCDKVREYYEEFGIAGLKLEDAIKKVTERPYTQYLEDDVPSMEELKNEKLVKKQKIRNYIKKIKIENLKNDDEVENNVKLIQ